LDLSYDIIRGTLRREHEQDAECESVALPGGHGGYSRAVAELSALIHATLQG